MTSAMFSKYGFLAIIMIASIDALSNTPPGCDGIDIATIMSLRPPNVSGANSVFMFYPVNTQCGTINGVSVCEYYDTSFYSAGYGNPMIECSNIYGGSASLTFYGQSSFRCNQIISKITYICDQSITVPNPILNLTAFDECVFDFEGYHTSACISSNSTNTIDCSEPKECSNQNFSNTELMNTIYNCNGAESCSNSTFGNDYYNVQVNCNGLLSCSNSRGVCGNTWNCPLTHKCGNTCDSAFDTYVCDDDECTKSIITASKSLILECVGVNSCSGSIINMTKPYQSQCIGENSCNGCIGCNICPSYQWTCPSGICQNSPIDC